MHNYKELNVWIKAVTLATDIYRATSEYPKSELHGITSQMRRCVVSISSNIAEGAEFESLNNSLVEIQKMLYTFIKRIEDNI